MTEERELRVIQGGRRSAGELADLPDETLLALVSRGDEEAFAQLYDRYARVAYGLSLRILRDQSLAEDAVQDAFLAVWRSAGSFLAERAKPSTWILTLVHRRAVDLVRREQRRRTSPLEPEGAEPGEGIEDEAVLRSRRRIAREALDRLPHDQRQALELAYYAGLTQSEIAERLGVPLGTVKSRMFTGLRRLRDLLADADLEDA